MNQETAIKQIEITNYADIKAEPFHIADRVVSYHRALCGEPDNGKPHIPFDLNKDICPLCLEIYYSMQTGKLQL